MRRAVHLVIALAIVYLTQAQPGLAGAKGSRGRIGPPGVPPAGKLKYCRVSSKITAFLKKVRSLKRLGARGRDVLKSKQRFHQKGWPYNCLYAGLNYEENSFETETYKCCMNPCKFPRYHHCINRYNSAAGRDRCNSEALRCIAKCISTKGNIGKAGRPGPVGEPGPPGLPGPPDPTGPKGCAIKTIKFRGSWCKQRSCIPI